MCTGALEEKKNLWKHKLLSYLRKDCGSILTWFSPLSKNQFCYSKMWGQKNEFLELYEQIKKALKRGIKNIGADIMLVGLSKNQFLSLLLTL